MAKVYRRPAGNFAAQGWSNVGLFEDVGDKRNVNGSKRRSVATGGGQQWNWRTGLS
jgi:hypothetical protein